MAFGLAGSPSAADSAAEGADVTPANDGADAAPIWRQLPAFEADPDTLLAATDRAMERPIAADAGVVVLYQDTSYRFDEAGRLTQHRHWIYRIVAAEAIPDWSTSQVRWAPWRQERPQLRARVITADGSEFWLDPASARDRQAPETDDRRAGERRLTEAPLPAVSVGAVVEEEIVLVDRRPQWSDGTTIRHYTALLAPTVDGRLTLEASTRLALRYGARKMPGLKPASTEVKDGKVRVVFDFADLPAVDPPQDGSPGHRPRFPQIAFSTGRDWAQVAMAFSERVDQAIHSAGLEAIGDELRAASGLAAAPRIAAILEAVRQRVSFNNFEIGARALDFDVDRTLERAEGDSLTLAIAAVAALRRAGLQAQVALVRTGFGVDVEPRLPGIGLFNHALVHLGAPDAEGVWLEPSARYARAGELTLAMQGRFALIASPETAGLVRTPASEPQDNLAVEVREIFFADFGPGRLVERCKYFGSAERTQRRITGSLDDLSRRRGYEAYVNAFHMASRLGELGETDPTDLRGPFELRLEAIDSSRVRTEVESAVLEVPVRELARRLPPVLLEDPRPRTEEFVFPEPFASRWRYEVHPPIGFRLTELPRSETVELGPARFQQSWRVDGEMIVGDLSFDVGQRLLAPRQFEALRASLGEFLERPPSVLRFELSLAPEASPGLPRAASWSDASLTSALIQLRRASDEEPSRASHRIRWALGLVQAGLGVEARLQAKEAVTLEPEWGLSHWAFGWTLLHDEAGTPFGAGAQLEAARRAFREAGRLMPEEGRVLAGLARLEERGTAGDRFGDGADLDRAAELYAKAAQELDDPFLHRDRLRFLLATGRFDDVEAAGKTARRKLAADVDSGLVGDLLGERGDVLKRGDLRAFELAAAAARGRNVTNAPAAVRRRAALELAAARHYDLAAAVAAGVDEALAARLTRAKRFEELELHPDDPTTPLRALLQVLRFDRPSPEKIAEWLRQGFGPFEVESLFRALRARIPTELDGVPLAPAARADLALADLAVTVNGAPHLGYRLTVGAGGDGDAAPARFYVTLRGEDLRVAGLGSRRSTLGTEALKRLGDGDLPGARRWLDWARAEPAEVEVTAGDVYGFDPFDRLWSAEPSDDVVAVDAARRAAAALAAPVSDGSLAILQQIENATRTAPEVTAAVEVALLDAYASAGDFLGLESHAGLLLERQPTSSRAFAKRLEALAALEQWGALEAAARNRVEEGYADADSRRVLAGIAVDRGEPKSAADLLRRVAAETELQSSDAANLLLLMLLEDPPPRTEAQALMARTRDAGMRDARWWRAVAAWHLERGRIRDGRAALAEAVDIGGGGLQLPDAYVVGRLAELCGMPETASDLYRRLESEAGAALRAPLFRLLAGKQLKP
ncbi:MAG: DUF3857 domain-containing protein [Acidobacteriota bacterium]